MRRMQKGDGGAAAAAWQNPGVIDERIAQFIRDPGADDFNELALAANRLQYEHIAPLRRLADTRGASPDAVRRWENIPAIPALAFKSLEMAIAPPAETFRSSGTLGERSIHQHPFPDLYRTAIDNSFPQHCLTGLVQPPMLSLVPTRDTLPDSSLAFMIDHVLARFGGPGSLTAIGSRGVDATRARGWLAARQRDARAGLILATSFALVELLAALERLDLRFRLPAGTLVFETGGYKGRTREVHRDDLLAGLSEYLGVPARAVVREYGMTELSSQLYASANAGGDPDVFEPPHWVRVRVLDPETLTTAAEGDMGLITILDLANAGSAVHVLTQDLGELRGAGVVLAGRAAGAELRGCSLTIEEMSG